MKKLEEKFVEIVLLNPNIKTILETAPELGIENWYLAAGCLPQTVWNHLNGHEITYGIKDYDLVYFDEDVSYEAEDVVIKRGKRLFQDLDVEIRNEARVHLWYKQNFGREIRQYFSVEDAISTFPTTNTSVGIRYENGQFKIYAPFGLDDTFAMTVRPNKTLITHKIYMDKVNKWKKFWPELKIIPWDN